MKDKKVVVVGAGMHSSLVVEILEMNGFSIVGLTDCAESMHGSKLSGYPILGGDDILPRLFSEGVVNAAIGIGSTGSSSCLIRKKIFELLRSLNFSIPILIHPSAVVSKRAELGFGSQILAGSIIQTNAKIMDNVLINAGAIVEHDCVISNHSALGSGAILCGGVFVGEASHIGANSAVRQGLNIGKHSTVGMGSAVISNVQDFSVALGVPAKTTHSER